MGKGERTMLKLYGVSRSRATRNIWLMEELGMAYDQIPVIQAYRLKGGDAPLNTASPAFLAINPAGHIPCIDDDGFVLAESLAINLYLATKAGGPMAPADARERALMDQWALFAVADIEAAALELYYPYAEKRDGTDEGAARIAAAALRLERPMAALNGHLAGHSHMVGGRFTVADINMAEVVRYASAHAPLMAACPAVATWLAQCQARPSFQKMWAKRLAEPA
jgi:glutathione S-transferase